MEDRLKLSNFVGFSGELYQTAALIQLDSLTEVTCDWSYTSDLPKYVNMAKLPWTCCSVVDVTDGWTDGRTGDAEMATRLSVMLDN